MPRRGNEVVQLPLPPRKKTRVMELPPAPSTPSLDVSFSDDEALPPGIIFTDIQQKKWRIGKPIGRGSFGRIYLASDDVDKDVTKLSARYVIKIEPHTNGPLFVEVHCMIRTAQASNVKEWRIQHNQKRLGMPIYIASGSFTDETSGTKYRFLVLPRYEVDLHKIIARSRSKVLDIKNVLVLAIQILDVLECLHSEGYTHSDIKSSNLMLGYDGSKIGKGPAVRLTPSFQKEIKEAVLSTKHRKVKPKSRSSNYYIDEDFVAKDYKSDDDGEKQLATVKKKLRRILTDKDSRILHRHHAFNLRQLTNYVNYEDLNSSSCSDQSYQKLIDDFGHKNLIQTTKQFQESKANSAREKIMQTKELERNESRLQERRTRTKSDSEQNEIYNEAVLSQSNRQIYLLDYGLASKFLDTEGKHKEFSEDARKAHDGTLEYSSRDSHIGAHSRRSDLETLGYNLLDWLTRTLPWKTPEVLAEPDLVHAIKKNYMSDLKLLLKTCFKTEFHPQFMEKYLQYVTSLDFTEKPDYEYCRNLFKDELFKTGGKLELNFSEPPMSPINRNKLCYSNRFGRKNTSPNFLAINGIKKSVERENVCSLENDLKLELLRQTLNISSEGFRKPCASRNFFISDADLVARLKKSLMPHGVFGKKLSPKNLRSKQKHIKKRMRVCRHRDSMGQFGNFMGSARQFTWAEILAGNPEDIIRKERNQTDEDFDDENCKYRIRKLSNASEASNYLQSPILQKDYLQDRNPTDAMKDVIAILQNNVSGVKKDDTEIPEGYTPAMVKVLKAKQERETNEKLEAMKTIPKKEVKRTTRSKQTVAPLSIITIQKASTESKEEIKKKPAKSVEPSSRVTRQKASIDSAKLEEFTVKSNVRTKSKSNRKSSKKEIKTVHEKKEQASPKIESDYLQSPIIQKDYLQDRNPTDTKKGVIAILQNKVSGVKKDDTEIPEEYTPAMVKVLKAKQERETNEKLEAMKTIPKKEVKRTTRSKQTVAPLSIITIQKASTESKEEIKKKPAKSVEPSSRVTRQKASIDSAKLEEFTVKSNVRTKSKSNRKSSNKEIKTVHEKKEQASPKIESDYLQSPIIQKDYLQDRNPTDTKKDVIAILQNKVSGVKKDDTEIPEEYTPAMVKVLKAKQERETNETLEAMKTIPKKEVKRTTRSMQTVAPLSIITRQKASTESKEDIRKKRPKSVEPSSRVTRQKASIDSAKSEEFAVKSNVRTKSKSNRESSKKEIKTVDEEKKQASPKIEKKPSKKSSVTISNRMRLRSCSFVRSFNK